jgi:hypothetical protein
MARVCDSAGISDLHVHDFRKAVMTWLREVRREREDVISAIMHHSLRGASAHYDFATLEGPVRKALQAWADHVEAVSRSARGEATATNVTPLHA